MVPSHAAALGVQTAFLQVGPLGSQYWLDEQIETIVELCPVLSHCRIVFGAAELSQKKVLGVQSWDLQIPALQTWPAEPAAQSVPPVT
jgi:hypothetical protein